LKITNCHPTDKYRYELKSTQYRYSDGDYILTVEACDGDLEVAHEYEDEKVYLEENNIDFWVGAVLFWYDADLPTTKFFGPQVDAVARLSHYLGYVPDEETIKTYAVPNKEEYYSYSEMIAKLEEDNRTEAVYD
tara:strand:- start:2324 stop:2725 length:402 start_codon:yes stop_codon:yes gene_type:complete